MADQLRKSARALESLTKLLTLGSVIASLGLALFPLEIFAAHSCAEMFLPQQPERGFKEGAQLLHERDSKLHISPYVQEVVNRHKRRTGATLTKPADKINAWLSHVEALSNRATKSSRSNFVLKNALYEQYVMKAEDVPETYYAQQARIARDRGHGNLVPTKHQKAEMAKTVISDLKSSLDSWVDYFTSRETQAYPTWLKYWMFTGMTKLSKYDPQTGTFGNRSKETVAPFPEINSEALAYVADAVLKKLNKQSLLEINDPEYLNLLEGMNFGKLYGRTLFKLGIGKEGRFISNSGEWRLFPQGKEYMPLVNSLKGRNTGWCTAGEWMAKSQLEKGDFYVYYSLDQNGDPVIPRVAIRMEGKSIAEVRGVAADQNLDSQISQSTVVSSKMKEFGSEGEKYSKKDNDMRLLTQIEAKQSTGRALSREELVFLYEMDSNIQSFGRKTDPRIAEIKSQRDQKDDYVIILQHKYTRDEISFSREEVLGGRSKIHFGDLDLNDLTSVDGLKLPEIINGGFKLNGITLTAGLRLPVHINGYFHLNGITSASGLILPEVVKGPLVLAGLTSAVGLKLPKGITALNLSGLTSPAGLKLPKTFNGSIYLDGLKTVDGLELPETLNGDLTFKLTSAPGLILPRTMNGSLFLNKLKFADGVEFPITVNGHVYLDGLSTTAGLRLSESINGILSLSGLTSASSLKLPRGVLRFEGPADVQR